MAQRKYSLQELLSEEELADFYGAAPKPVAPPPEEKGGFIDAIQNYGGSWAEGLGTGIEDYFGKGPVSGGLQEWGREVQQENPLSGELFSVTGLKELVGGMLPTVTGALGGAAAGTFAGGPVGGVIGGIAGGMAGYQPVAYKNISDYQKEQGYTNPDAKLAGSIASAGLEAAFGPERRIIGSMLTAAAKKLPKETLDGLIAQAFKKAPRKEGEGWLKYVLKDLNRIGIVEGTTEVAQSATERAFGGAPMANKDALRDYAYSAAGGYIGGGLFGGAMAPFSSIPGDPKAANEAAREAQRVKDAARNAEIENSILTAEAAKEAQIVRSKSDKVINRMLGDITNATDTTEEWIDPQMGISPVFGKNQQAIDSILASIGVAPPVMSFPDDSGIETISSRDPTTDARLAGMFAEPAAQQDAFGISEPEVIKRIDTLIEGAKRPRFGTVGMPATEAKAIREDLLLQYYRNPSQFLERLNKFEIQKAQKDQAEATQQPTVAPGQRALFRDDGTPTTAALQPTEEERDFRNFQENEAYRQRAQVTAMADALKRAQTPAPIIPEVPVAQEAVSPRAPVTQMPTRQGNIFTKEGKPSKFKENPYGMQEEEQAPAAEKDVNTVEMFGPKGGVTAAARATTKAGKAPAPVQEATPAPAPTPKTDGSSAVVGATGMRIVHGSGNPNLTAADIQIVRQGQKQGKKGRSYGGLYGAAEADLAHAEEYAKMMGGTPTVYDLTIRPGTKIFHKNGDITRLSEQYINDLVSQGYGVVTGKDMRGRSEYAVIDRDSVATMQPRVSKNAAPVVEQPAPTPAPVQPAAPVVEQPAAPVQPAAVADPEKAAIIPGVPGITRAYLASIDVSTDRVKYLAGKEKFEKGASINADDAIRSIDADIAKLQQLIKCLGG